VATARVAASGAAPAQPVRADPSRSADALSASADKQVSRPRTLEHAREKDPFAKVGHETVAVEVTSVVRASDTSFQVRWLERTFEGGALKDTRRLTGLFSIVITPPRTVEAVRRNPLGIYVHAFNWSQDVTSGDPK
jgi:type IV secretory pathway TrbF-like protein